MSTITTDANTAFRDFIVDGVPSSGPNEPDKSSVRAVFAEIDTAISALNQTSGLIVASTLAYLNANYAAPAAGTGALVVADVIAGASVSRARASNVVTIVMDSSAHVPVNGQKVNINGFSDSTFNATGVTVTSVSSATFTYANTGSNVSTTADTGGQVDRKGVYAFQSSAWTWLSLSLSTGLGGVAIPVFNTRADLTAAGAAGLLSGVNQVYTLGNASPTDGAGARYSRGSYIYTTQGFGVDPASLLQQNSPLVLGISMSTGSSRSFDADVTDLGTDTNLQPQRRHRGLTSRLGGSVITLDATLTFAVMDGNNHSQWQVLTFASNITQELDCSCVMQSYDYCVANIKNSNSGVVLLDAGPTGTWTGYSGTRYLSVPKGNKVKFFKSGVKTFEVSSVSTDPTCSAPTGTNVHTALVRSNTLLVMGQSLGEIWTEGTIHAAFCQRLAVLGFGAPYLINTSVGGSALCKADLDTPSSNYWVDDSSYDPLNPLTSLADGPNLTACLAAIVARGGDATQPAINMIMLSHGQQTSGYIDCPQATNASLLVQKVLDCYAYWFKRVRDTCHSNGSGTNVPIVIEIVGRRTGVLGSNLGRMQAMRQTQWALVAATTNGIEGPDTYDLPLADSVHPIAEGQNWLGARHADVIASNILSYTHTGTVGDPLLVLPKPTVATAVLNTSTNTILVTFTTDTNDRLNIPADAFGFRVLDESTPSAPVEQALVRCHWVLTSTYEIQIFFSTKLATGMTFYLAHDYLPGFDYNRTLALLKNIQYLPNNGEQDKVQRISRSFESGGGNSYVPIRPAKITL